MIDEANTPESHGATTASPTEDAQGAAGYCQECGRTLTRTTLRRVDSGIFCEPCATVRAFARQSAPGWQPFQPHGYPGTGPAGAVPPPASEPNPVFAGILGLIPGVGAMFNGQYAKGAVHLIVFVVLLALADNLYWAFWWLVWGWIFYQAFDAYHTARARRDNLPLPNPFGWNDIGERIGFNRTSPPPSAYAPPPPSQSRRAGANWAGYVPPTGPPASPYAPYAPYASYAEPASQNPYAAPYAPPQPPPVAPTPPPPTSVPYGPTFTGGLPAQPLGTPAPFPGTHRFPIGAIWLIVLGLLFLMANILPGWRLNGRWLVPALLAAVAFWTALRRWETWRTSSSSLACVMVAPIMLFTVSALLALDAAHLATMHRSWPVLLVVWGGMLLIKRTGTALQPPAPIEMPLPAPPPVRSTSGTGSLGL